MNNDIEALTEALQQNLHIVQMLSKRIELLEEQLEESAAQRMALMLLLRSTVQNSSESDQIAATAERLAALMQVQPGVLLHGGKSTFQKMKSQLNWMTAPSQQHG